MTRARDRLHVQRVGVPKRQIKPPRLACFKQRSDQTQLSLLSTTIIFAAQIMVFGLFSRKPALEQPVQQLRTPSPSLPGERNDSNARLVDGADSPFEGSPAPCPPPASPSPQPVYRDAAGLRKLIAGVPAQTLHEYTLTNLRNSEPSQAVLIAFSKFFDQLAPPPKLHCIRCHKEYFEVRSLCNFRHSSLFDPSGVVTSLLTSYTTCTAD